jgi:hypothetical protein
MTIDTNDYTSSSDSDTGNVRVRDRKTPRKYLKSPAYLDSLTPLKISSILANQQVKRDWYKETIYNDIIEGFSVKVGQDKKAFGDRYGYGIEKILNVAELYRIPIQDIYDKVIKRASCNYLKKRLSGRSVARNVELLRDHESIWREYSKSLESNWDQLLKPLIAKDQKMLPATNVESGHEINYRVYKNISAHIVNSATSGIRDLVVIIPKKKYLLRFICGGSKILFILRHSVLLTAE